jgi:hypothetical protein
MTRILTVAGPGKGYRRKPSGRRRREAQMEGNILGEINGTQAGRTRVKARLVKRLRSVHIRVGYHRMEPTTWRETCGNGWRIGTTRVITSGHRTEIRKDLTQGGVVVFAEGRGSSPRGTFARRPAPGTTRRPGTSTSVFVAPSEFLSSYSVF